MNIWKILEARKGEFKQQVTDLLEDREAILAKMHFWPAKAYVALALVTTFTAFAVEAAGYLSLAVVVFYIPILVGVADLLNFLYHKRRLRELEETLSEMLGGDMLLRSIYDSNLAMREQVERCHRQLSTSLDEMLQDLARSHENGLLYLPSVEGLLREVRKKESLYKLERLLKEE